MVFRPNVKVLTLNFLGHIYDVIKARSFVKADAVVEAQVDIEGEPMDPIRVVPIL